jgi:hypothetical protein
MNKNQYYQLLKIVKKSYPFTLVDSKGNENEFVIKDENLYVHSDVFNADILIRYNDLENCELKNLYNTFKERRKNEH